MSVTLYGIKNCDSVKKAMKFLQSHNIEFEFVDFKTTPPTLSQVKKWTDAVGIKKIFNTRSTTYRNLNLKEIAQTDQEKIEWMVKEPLLIKRPVIETSTGEILVGYDESSYTRSML